MVQPVFITLCQTYGVVCPTLIFIIINCIIFFKGNVNMYPKAHVKSTNREQLCSIF
jgi:hypothetical protein